MIQLGGTVQWGRMSRRRESWHGIRMIEVEVTTTAGLGSFRAGPHGYASGNRSRRSAPVTHLGETSELMTQVPDA